MSSIRLRLYYSKCVVTWRFPWIQPMLLHYPRVHWPVTNTNIALQRRLTLLLQLYEAFTFCDGHGGVNTSDSERAEVDPGLYAWVPTSDASIYRKYRNSISIYRIVSNHPRKYRNFRYTVIDFLIYRLAEFSRVVSRSREISTETFIETFTKVSMKIWRLLDTTRENSARESLNFSL